LLLAFALPATAMDILVLGLFKDMAILRIDGTQHKLRAGQASPEGVKLISASSDEAVLEIDGKRASYALGSHTSVGGGYAVQPDKAQAQIWPRNGMYLTPGSVNGQPVNFLVDTGATWVAMNSGHAKRLGIDFRVRGQKSQAATASGVAAVWLVPLDRVKVGAIELRNVEGAVLEGDSPREILLGMSFLRRVEMLRQGEMMLLKKRF
jgi:aspartyl protease family protein